MPTYEYKRTCGCEGATVELQAPISGRDSQTCGCGAPLERVLFPRGANAVVLPRRYHDGVTKADVME